MDARRAHIGVWLLTVACAACHIQCKMCSRLIARRSVSKTHQRLDRGQGRRAVTVRAQSQGDKNDNTDWDAAWRRFQKQVSSQVDSQPVTTTTRTFRPSAPRTSQEQLRAQERVLLDLWTNEDAVKWGSVAALCGLLTVILMSGAPVDDRCTLPWC